MEQDCVTFI